MYVYSVIVDYDGERHRLDMAATAVVEVYREVTRRFPGGIIHAIAITDCQDADIEQNYP